MATCTARADWWGGKFDLAQRRNEALEAGGCSIPYPQRDEHVINDAAPLQRVA